MANRYPLVLDVEDNNKIKELPEGDSLYLFGNTIEEVGNINSVGVINAAEIRVNDQVIGPTSFSDLSDTPSDYINQNNKILKVNDAGTGVEFVSAQDLGALSGGSISIAGDIYPTTDGAGQVGLSDKKWQIVRATGLQGNLLNNNQSVVFDADTGKITGTALSGNNVSIFVNDANYVTLSSLNSTTPVNIKANIYGEDNTLLVDASENTHLGILKANLVASDDTVIVDYTNKTITADVYSSSGSQIIDSATKSVFGEFSGNLTGNVYSASSSVLIDHEESNHYGTFIGSVYASLPSYPGAPMETYALVDHLTGDHYGQFIGSLDGNVVYSADNFTLIDAETLTHYGTFSGDLIGQDSSIIIDSTSSTLYGTFVGDVFGEDSAVLIDSVTGTHYGTFSGDLIGQDSSIIIDSTSSTVYGTFVGSVIANDSTVLLDGESGEIVGPIRDMTILGETGNTPSNTGSVNSWLEVSVNGNTRYIPLYA